ncbi:hypothetical protein AB4Y32_33795 [Paraburkholderia phymatum]|uniref:Uncharacterized protein n=1 Tax=Paraburkholderia phymatum TaxID=148447 RepID=A0ACC6UB10_9BURK
MGRQLSEKFCLHGGVDPLVYGMGIKERRENDPKPKAGLVIQTAGC